MTGMTARSTSHMLMRGGRDIVPTAQGSKDEFLIHAYSRDASHFLMTPSDVLIAESIADIVRLFREASESGHAITFRSGGSSLSGQAVTKEVLLDVRRHFSGTAVMDDGRLIQIEPGVTIRHANALLRPYGYRLGPDPASEIACTLGGALANNSSGMTCGTEFNAYRTLESMVFVLPSGTIIDTSREDAEQHLQVAESKIYQGLLAIRDRLRSNPLSVAEIERLFSLKNTMGYSINAFLDFDKPTEILSHLLIGSEGTLGFIASAVLRTVRIAPVTATALSVFPSIVAASEVLPNLTATQCRAIELMDARAIRVAQQAKDPSRLLPPVLHGTEALLLLEITGETPQEMQSNLAEVTSVVEGSGVASQFTVAPDSQSEQQLWRARKGLYAMVAGARPSGTSALLEDVAVPVEQLTAACSGISELLDVFGYRDSVIFGHARDGNLHFLLNEDFSAESGLDRYARFTDRLVDLILDNGGTLKAEHGTGRVMAPYLIRQYGPELTSVMVDLKRLIDPGGILNPDVIISADSMIHLKDLKTTPQVEEVVDRCVDCGFCEPVCPSRSFTTTPRQRIAIQRASAQARRTGDLHLVNVLAEELPNRVIDSCAVDGMCGSVCPLGINTGALVQDLRAARISEVAQRMASIGADNWGVSVRTAALGVTIAHRFPRTVRGVTGLLRKLTASSKIPLVGGGLPSGGRRRRPVDVISPDVIYLPSCMNTLFAAPSGLPGVDRAFLALCEEAGISVRIPDGIGDLCCGTPWKSKGLRRGYKRMQDNVRDLVIRESQAGVIPVVSDATSCTEGFSKILKTSDTSNDVSVRVIDVVQFTLHELIPRLPQERRKFDSMTLHPTCSVVRLGLEADFQSLAGEVARSTKIPDSWGCCAFAGDRGLLVPGLTQAATQDQAREVDALQSQVHASCNRTCEIGMSRATDTEYGHIVEYLALALGIDFDVDKEGERV